MNTTQFGWVRNKLPHQPRPIGTIYEPEVAARAVLYAARHPHREINVGYTTIESILGNKYCPAYVDWYLACKGFKGQQTGNPADPNAEDNLWNPLKGDRGAHGAFGDQSTRKSPLLWAERHKWMLLTGLTLSIGLLGWAMGKLAGKRAGHKRGMVK